VSHVVRAARIPPEGEERDSQAHALAELVAEVAGELGIQGRVAFTGDVPLGFGHQMLDHLMKRAPRDHGGSVAAGRAERREHDEERGRTGEDPPLLARAVEAMQRVRAELGSLKRKGEGFVTRSGELRHTRPAAPAAAPHVRGVRPRRGRREHRGAGPRRRRNPTTVAMMATPCARRAYMIDIFPRRPAAATTPT
jgi:hypothetical protein